MVVQDPPVFVDINIDRHDEKFDSNKLKAYTKSGIYIDYIVWPPLYLHEDGNLLFKGIAQCKEESNYNIPGQIVPSEEDEDNEQVHKHNSNTENDEISSNVPNVNEDTSLPIEKQEESREIKGASNGDNTKNKKLSLTKKIKYQVGKGEKNQTCCDSDQTKPTKVTSKNEENHCGISQKPKHSQIDVSETSSPSKDNKENNNIGKPRTEENEPCNLEKESIDTKL